MLVPCNDTVHYKLTSIHFLSPRQFRQPARHASCELSAKNRMQHCFFVIFRVLPKQKNNRTALQQSPFECILPKISNFLPRHNPGAGSLFRWPKKCAGSQWHSLCENQPCAGLNQSPVRPGWHRTGQGAMGAPSRPLGG